MEMTTSSVKFAASIAMNVEIPHSKLEKQIRAQAA
jgi:hypothetical protein